LWRYNLHYFDFLHWDAIPADFKPAYIDSWLAANPIGCEDAWEPYTVSLRIVNWVKYFSTLPEVPERWQASLLNQGNWLHHNLEHHILANHYYKNAKALVFVGAYFEGATAGRLLDDGARLFVAETREQVLYDGGHFERSPMYHCIVLEDLIDVLNLMQANPTMFAAADVAVVDSAVTRAARFLDLITCADGQIPLFNDSAHGIAPAVDELLDYAMRQSAYQRLAPARQPVRISLPDSGYFGYRVEDESLLIDCGRIGPDYQPGHPHCDMLSFELCVQGRRVIVDPGVHGYENDATRPYLRSTSAHNTVSLDDAEQSEIWGTFRVARRAEPVRPQMSQIDQGRLVFSGGHSGFRRLPQRAIHRRELTAALGSRWSVHDQVEGEGSGTARSYLHVAAGIEVEAESGHEFRLVCDGQLILRLFVDSTCDVQLDEAYVAPEFGQKLAAPVVVISRSGPLPLELKYHLECPPAGRRVT